MSNQPPTLAFDLDRDLRALSAMASNLTPYLYEKELYGFLAGDLPKLTLGGMLLRLHRLSCLDDILDADQQGLVRDARRNIEAGRKEWTVHFEARLQQELHARLNALDQFLMECSEDMAICAAGYPVQAEKRTMIEHLRMEAEERGVWSDELGLRLQQIDSRLRRLFQEGEFISDARLMKAYPREHFWWLYGHLPEGRR